MPSEDTKEGKEEEAKLELTFFAKCQKGREERLLYFRRRNVFGVTKNKFCTVPGYEIVVE